MMPSAVPPCRRRAVEGVAVIVAAASISAFWLLVFYPGAMNYDALWHWRQALDNRYDAWHPPFLAMLAHATQYVTDRPDLITWVQGTFFWAGLFFLLKQAAVSSAWFMASCVFIAAVPSLWLYSNTMSSNAWMTGLALLSISRLIPAVRDADRPSFWIAVAWFSGAVMFRREALVLLPVFLLVFYRYLRVAGKPMTTASLCALIVLLCITPARIVELAPTVEASDIAPGGHGLFNQYVGILARAGDGLTEVALQAERSDIDARFGAGTFDRLLAGYRCRSGGYIAGAPIGTPRIIKAGIPRQAMPFLLRKVAAAAARHPLAFIEHNLCYYKNLLQIPRVAYQHYGTLREDGIIEIARRSMGVQFESRLPWFKERYVQVVAGSLEKRLLSQVYAHHWLLLAALLTWAWGVRSGRPEMWLPGLFAAVYPLGYFLFGPTNLWRYLLFSHACGWACVALSVQRIVGYFQDRAVRSAP